MPDNAQPIRPLAALGHLLMAAILLVAAFYAFKYAYFLVTEQPADLGLKAGADKVDAAAESLKRLGKK